MQIFKVTYYLRPARKKKDGSIPVGGRIVLNGDRCDIGVPGVCVPTIRDWDERKGRLKGKSASVLQANRILDTLEQEYCSIFRRLEYSGELALSKIKEEYEASIVKEKKGETVLNFMDEYLEESKSEVGIKHKHANYTRYERVRKDFASFLWEKYHKKDICFSGITLSVIENFDKWLRAKKLHNNTVAKRLRILKTMMTTAFQRGKAERHPFDGFKFHFVATDRGYLTEEELKKIIDKDFDIPRLKLVRDLFVFSCFTGLAYIDMANLTKDNLVELDGKKWILTKRQKTNINSNILLLDIPLALIQRYKGQSKDGHLLPSYSNQKINAYLKEIADVCGIQKNLTFHLARHTFATMFLSKGVPMESVSKMLGHANIRTTQIYNRALRV